MTEKQLEEMVGRHGRLIRALARQYSIRGHHSLNEDDLYCEGLKLLVEIGRGLDETSFSKMFRKSLRNRFIDLIRFFTVRDRCGVELELDSEMMTGGSISLDELFIRKKLEHLSKMLKLRHSRRVLLEITFPSKRTLVEAMKDYVRGKHLFVRGKISNESVFCVRSEHIGKTLGLTKSTVEGCLREIKAELTQMARNSV